MDLNDVDTDQPAGTTDLHVFAHGQASIRTRGPIADIEGRKLLLRKSRLMVTALIGRVIPDGIVNYASLQLATDGQNCLNAEWS